MQLLILVFPCPLPAKNVTLFVWIEPEIEEFIKSNVADVSKFKNRLMSFKKVLKSRLFAFAKLL